MRWLGADGTRSTEARKKFRTPLKLGRSSSRLLSNHKFGFLRTIASPFLKSSRFAFLRNQVRPHWERRPYRQVREYPYKEASNMPAVWHKVTPWLDSSEKWRSVISENWRRPFLRNRQAKCRMRRYPHRPPYFPPPWL